MECGIGNFSRLLIAIPNGSGLDQDRLLISPDLGTLRFLKIKSAAFPALRVFITIHICCFDLF